MPQQEFKLFDAHLHIIDRRFDLIPNDGYLPDEFTCDDYRYRMRDYALAGGAVVSGSFQGFDQDYLRDALNRLGPSFVGVIQLPLTAPDEDILELERAGVRAVRFNIQRGGSEELKNLAAMAHRIYELARWHVELYVDSRALDDLYRTLVELPAVCIDHLGLSKDGFGSLLRLAENGVRVKATGFGRTDFDIHSALRALYSASPDSLMFGTDLPSTRAPRPYDDSDFALVNNVLGDQGAAKVLHDNAVNFYRPGEG